jgi:hypothetical protein
MADVCRKEVDDILLQRVDRVLGLLSSRPNWDPPTQSPVGESVPTPPPFGLGEGHTRLRERGWGGGIPIGRGDIHCGTLGIFMYFVFYTMVLHIKIVDKKCCNLGPPAGTPSTVPLRSPSFRTLLEKSSF